MRHNDIKNHVCPTCGLRKVTGHELRVHMRCHSQIQYPYDELFDGPAAIEQKKDFDCSSDYRNEKMNKGQPDANVNVTIDDQVQVVAANAQGQSEQMKDKSDDDENKADLDAFDDFDCDGSDNSEDKIGKEVFFFFEYIMLL